MNLEFYPKETLKKELKKIVGKNVDLSTHALFFFGSRVTGTQDEHSDIDIGIEGPVPLPFEILAKIKEDISKLPLLYKIDIIDFKNVEDDFYKIAKQHIELIK